MSSRTAPTPREWVGVGPWPWPAVTSLGAGATLVACYSLSAVQTLRTRQDKPYVRLQLTDTHGSFEARIWDDAERLAEGLAAGMFVGVRGRIEIFNNERQLKVEDVVPIHVEGDDLALFMPRSERDPGEMDRELRTAIASVDDTALRSLLQRVLGPGTETGQAFRRAPAAKFNHHAWIGGLLEHTLSVTRLVDALARHYGAEVDRDLLVAGALLHDLGKIREIEAVPGFPYTDEGKLLGHILLGLELLEDAARIIPVPPERLTLLRHLVASHQGRYEWQSPREPRILEGLLLHYADDLDAKVAQAQRLLTRVRDGWTPWDRSLGRELLKHRGSTLRDAPGDADAPGSDFEEEEDALEKELPRMLDLFGDL